MCGVCLKACRTGAISKEGDDLVLDTDKCNFCGRCVKALFGNTIHRGEELLPVVTSEEQLFRVTDAAIQFFDDHANPGERFQFTIERVGIDKFKEVLRKAYDNE